MDIGEINHNAPYSTIVEDLMLLPQSCKDECALALWGMHFPTPQSGSPGRGIRWRRGQGWEAEALRSYSAFQFG